MCQDLFKKQLQGSHTSLPTLWETCFQSQSLSPVLGGAIGQLHATAAHKPSWEPLSPSLEVWLQKNMPPGDYSGAEPDKLALCYHLRECNAARLKVPWHHPNEVGTANCDKKPAAMGQELWRCSTP